MPTLAEGTAASAGEGEMRAAETAPQMANAMRRNGIGVRGMGCKSAPYSIGGGVRVSGERARLR
ncbi:hypothetical protein GALLR39Z86_44980 [Glycomyces algeriensis]|uniref:Uncharacterized protein n=1 Tax=Glycomyces algeriensis TaxID=256037 RepID=A0A9W6GDG5_9ACTN|nr:hypothetical protein GALLR39Z86_44980 [Glycomyces algeriensis]